MDLATIGQLIGAYGFPIVACGALFWYVVKEQRDTRTVLEELKSIIQSNTSITQQFLEVVKELRKGE